MTCKWGRGSEQYCPGRTLLSLGWLVICITTTSLLRL